MMHKDVLNVENEHEVESTANAQERGRLSEMTTPMFCDKANGKFTKVDNNMIPEVGIQIYVRIVQNPNVIEDILQEWWLTKSHHKEIMYLMYIGGAFRHQKFNTQTSNDMWTTRIQLPTLSRDDNVTRNFW